MTCPRCLVDPFSHSFVRFGSAGTNNASLYYTGIARMTSLDDYINLQRWMLHLDEITGPWIWVIDCANMELHNSIIEQFVSVFANILLNEHSKRLLRIVVVKPNAWFHRIMHILYKQIPQDILDSVWYIRSDLEFNRVRTLLEIPIESMMWLRTTLTIEPNRRLPPVPAE